MSAPKRTNHHRSGAGQEIVYLRPRAMPDPAPSFKRDVLAYPGAKAAFQKLTRTGMNDAMFWRWLWGVAYLKKAGKNQTSPWYALQGIPPHTLRRFPERVRCMADEIERVDAKIRSDKGYGPTVKFLPLFLAAAIPGAQVELRGDRDVLREVGTGTKAVPATRARDLLHSLDELPKLAELPKLLRFYADYIEVVSKLTAHHASKAPALLDRMMPIELTEAVKMQTGKPHWDEVATLLTAAFAAVGSDSAVDPRALQMQRIRHSRKK